MLANAWVFVPVELTAFGWQGVGIHLYCTVNMHRYRHRCGRGK